MLSCQQTQNVIDGKKRIIQNPTEAQRRDTETITFAEDEVYGIDVLVSSGDDGKVCFAPSSGENRELIVMLQGKGGRFKNDYLSKGGIRHVSIKTQELSCRVF